MIQFRFALACIGSAILAASAHGQTRIERSGPEPVPQETRLPDQPVVIPMERDFGWAVVAATINGQGPFRLVFDTGAPGLLLQQRTADKLELSAPEGMDGAHVQVRVAGPGGEGLPASLHTADSLKLGQAEFRNLRAIATQLPMPSDIDGVLGMGVLKNCLVTLDYPAARMRLERGELAAPDGREILEFTQTAQRHSHPTIKVEVCGQPVEFIIDTGMTGWFRFTKEVTERCSLLQGPVAGPMAHSADRAMPTQVVRLSGGLNLAGYRFDAPHGMMDEMDLQPLVGGRALEHFAFSIDQKNRRVRFARPDRAAIVPPALRTLGFRPRRAEKGFVVWNLTPGSPAEKAGLKDNDLLISLNELTPERLTSGLAWDALLDARQVRVRYRSENQSEPKEADIPVTELLPEIHVGSPPQRIPG